MTSDNFEQTAAKSLVCIAEMRETADRLVTNIGSADAKEKARRLRIKATKWERFIEQWRGWIAAGTFDI